MDPTPQLPFYMGWTWYLYKVLNESRGFSGWVHRKSSALGLDRHIIQHVVSCCTDSPVQAARYSSMYQG